MRQWLWGHGHNHCSIEDRSVTRRWFDEMQLSISQGVQFMATNNPAQQPKTPKADSPKRRDEDKSRRSPNAGDTPLGEGATRHNPKTPESDTKDHERRRSI
jgi:hypothetical protein